MTHRGYLQHTGLFINNLGYVIFGCVIFGCDIFEKIGFAILGYAILGCVISGSVVLIFFLIFLTSNFKLILVHLGSSGFIWDHLESTGSAPLIISANHLGSSGIHLEFIWNHLESSGIPDGTSLPPSCH